MESDIEVMVDTYSLFTKYEIVIPQEDYDQVDSLRINFNQMIQHSKEMSLHIADLQSPLLEELTSGISLFHSELATFNSDYETKGPMIQGITAKEASDRVTIFVIYGSILLCPCENVANFLNRYSFSFLFFLSAFIKQILNAIFYLNLLSLDFSYLIFNSFIKYICCVLLIPHET